MIKNIISSKVNLGVALFINATIAFAAPVDNNTPIDKFNASLGLAIENSDNIFLTATNRNSETIFHEIFSANYTRNSPTVQTQFSLNVDHQQYQNKTFADQTVYSSLLGLNAILIKNRLTWNVNNKFQRVPVNIAARNLPSNQENVNHFNTGPTFVVLQNNRQFLNLSLNYNKTYTQKTEIDSSGYTAEAVYSRNLTRTFTMKLNVNHSVRNYANTAVNTDYSRTDSTVTFLKRMRLSEFDLTGGRSNIVRKGATNVEEPIIRADYNYKFGEKASLNMNYDRELGDFTGLYANTVASYPQGLPNVGSVIFLMEQGNFSIERNFGHSSVAYNYTYFTASYDNPALNTTSKISKLSYTDKLSTSLVFGLSGSYNRNTFNDAVRRDTVRIYNGSLSKKMSDVYDLLFNFQYISRGSNIALLAYTERRLMVSGTYHF